MTAPSVTLNNGKVFPLVGLGTFESKDGEVQRAVLAALRAGYRHVDCARVYGNEREVGEGLRLAFSEGICTREEVWVTSKVWNTHHRHVATSLKQTLADLQLEYVDLLLVHWPQAYAHSNETLPMDSAGNMLFDTPPHADTWKCMEEVCKAGLAHSIGVSNFNIAQVERLLGVAEIAPVVNQVEVHPYLVNEELVRYCQGKGVEVTAYCPLGAPKRPWAKTGDPELLEDPRLLAISARVGKTPAQVLLRFQVQRRIAVIPKSVTPSRIAANIAISDFTLSDADMQQIRAFDKNWRSCDPVRDMKHPEYPFHPDSPVPK